MKISAATLSLLALDEYTSQQCKNGQSAAISRAHFYDLVYTENSGKDFLEQCGKDGHLAPFADNIGKIFFGKPKERGEAEKILGAEACKVFKALAKAVDGIVSIFDEEFPFVDIPDSAAQDRPFLFFYRGDLALLDQVDKNVALVGLVDPPEEIRQRIDVLVPRLVAAGANIVSGLAKGCDQAAHEACLRAGGKAIAILPSPLDRIYPRENAKLAREIVKCGGLLLSEYYRAPLEDWEFSRRAISRDRLQAMFACSIILAASHEPGTSQKSFGQQGEKSVKRQSRDCGSRHAMEKARDYKRRRVVLYDANNDKDKACLALNRQYFDFNESLLIKDLAFIALADPANDDLEKLLGAAAENGKDDPAENMPECGEAASANCPDCDDAPGGEDNFDDSCSQIPAEIEAAGYVDNPDPGESADSFSYEDYSQEEFTEQDASQEYDDFPGPAEDREAYSDDRASPPGVRSCKPSGPFWGKSAAGQETGKIPPPAENSKDSESSGKEDAPGQSLLMLDGVPAGMESHKRKKAPASAREEKKSSEPADEVREKRKKGKKRARIREDQFRLF